MASAAANDLDGTAAAAKGEAKLTWSKVTWRQLCRRLDRIANAANFDSWALSDNFDDLETAEVTDTAKEAAESTLKRQSDLEGQSAEAARISDKETNEY